MPYSILSCSWLRPSTAESSPPPESSKFLCPLLSLSIPLPVAPQCHLSNDVLVFRLILHPLSATLCFLWSIYCLSFGRCVQPISILNWLRIGMSVTPLLCLMMVLRILSFSLTFSSVLLVARWLVSSFFTNAFVRDHVWYPYVTAGKTH